jgi:hypothetical protein
LFFIDFMPRELRPPREQLAPDPPVTITFSADQVDEANRHAAAMRHGTHQLLASQLTVLQASHQEIIAMERALADAEHLQGDVAQNLAQDRDRLLRIDAKIAAMDSLIARGRVEIISIIRKMCRDRCFLFLIVLTLVAVSMIGALFIRDAIKDAKQGGQTTVVVQDAPATTTASPR